MKIRSEIVGQKKSLQFLRRLGKYGQQAIVRATNRTGSTAKKLSDQEIREQVSLNQKQVLSRLYFRQATKNRVEYVIWAEKRGRLLSRYSHRVLKKGVKVKVKKGGPQKLIPGAFKTRVKAGGRWVEVIAGPGERNVAGRRKRYRTGSSKIDVFYGPSVSQVFNQTRDRITNRVNRRFEEQIDKELANALKRLKRS
jgi:hypothetical protein